MKLQFLSFAVVGALGFLVDATALQLLLNLAGLDPYTGRLGSFLIAVTFTWAMNRHFTFGSDDPRLLREWFRFLGANGLGAGVNLGTYAALVWAVPLVAAHPVLGVAAGSIAGLAVNFFGSRYFVFPLAAAEPARRPLDLSGFPWRPGGTQSFEFWLLAALALYTLLCLSPSSYGEVFRSLFVEPLGLYLGKSRPIRSDEYAVWTPFIQIAVNNGFSRFNSTSPYLEDLRNFNALPLKDWGLIFKPQFWGFFVLDPAWAYSLHHAVFIGAFLAGWRRLVHALGFGWTEATLAAFVIFFFPYTQLWWTTTGPLLAGFPWLILCFLWQAPAWKRVPVMAWLGACWLISHLYPPVILSCAFAGAVLLLAFRPREILRPSTLLCGLLGAAIGVGLALWYLQDAVAAMAGTVYPGARSVGGGQLRFWHWLTTFLPGLWSEAREPILRHTNYLEAAAGGCFFLVGSLFFSTRESLLALICSQDGEARAARRQLLVLGVGIAMISVWLLAPVPNWVGAVLLWDKIPGGRFVFALGVLVFMASLVYARQVSFSFTVKRFAVAALVLLGSFAAFRLHYQGHIAVRALENWGPVAFLLAVALLTLRLRVRPVPALLGSCVFAGGLVYGSFNPVQSSYPVFHRPQHSEAEAFRKLQSEHPENLLLTRETHGAILNAWGYRAIQHVLVSPQLDFFRKRFPDLPEAQFNPIFNRYAHVKLTDEPRPFVPVVGPGVLQNDVIRVPQAAFGVAGIESRQDESGAQLELLQSPPVGVDGFDGHIDLVLWDPAERRLLLRGWANFSMIRPGNTLFLLVPGAEEAAPPVPIYRPDVMAAMGGNPNLAYSGFEISVRIAASDEAPKAACMWARDATGRVARLGGAADWSTGICALP